MPSLDPTGSQSQSSSRSATALMPVGAWIRIEMSGLPGVIGFTYVDQQAGLSARGWRINGASLDQSTGITVRLPMPGAVWSPLSPEEIRQFGLETPPSWVEEFYGPQPKAGSLWGAWREHPKLKGRFLPNYPNDLQVFVHDGGPRVSPNPAEAVWVTVNGIDGDVFQGRVLNQPHGLQKVRQGSAIRFIVADGAEFPIMVTEKYLAERGEWVIHPYGKCGFSELFDAPSDLIRVVFPNSPPDNPTSQSDGSEAISTPPQRRSWWRFWG